MSNLLKQKKIRLKREQILLNHVYDVRKVSSFNIKTENNR